MHEFSIPWGCLDGDKEQKSQEKNQAKTNKTFAQVLSNVCDIPTSQLPQPCVKGDGLAISIPEEEYLAGRDACKHNLHGRVVWSKGTTPLTVVALKNKLLPIWKDLARWGITLLGKGYYEFCFSSLEDVKRVRSVASWNLQSGFLKLFAWSPDFNPNLQKNTTAQVWVRMYGLAQEYWRPKILFAIASSIGTPICTDAIAAKPMFDRTFGHFARVLVDIDLSQTLRYKVLVERVGFAFYVDLDYENLPPFCHHCKMVGHYLESCKWVQNYDDGNQTKEPKNTVKNKNENTLKYVQKKDGRVEKNKNPEVIVVDDTSEKINDTSGSLGAGEHEIAVNNQIQPVLEPVLAVLDQPPLAPVLDAGLVDKANNNSFSVLAQQDDENIPVLEENVVAENVDSSSQDSEFIDETQVIPEVSEKNKDMQFLKESWANMSEKEDDEVNLLAALEKEPASSGFTMVASKSSKKMKVKAGKYSKADNSYGTRSKVCSTKPFK
ncbi:hypothetical protein QL285_039707 [Trifolium repens]|nr:hypothetical protein QL285_039707 [Trifolium repens]